MNATDWKTHIVRLVVSLPEQIYPIVPKQKRDASGADAQPCAPQKQEAQANWPGSTLIMMLRMQQMLGRSCTPSTPRRLKWSSIAGLRPRVHACIAFHPVAPRCVAAVQSASKGSMEWRRPPASRDPLQLLNRFGQVPS